jgi:hypothetical protein
MKNRTFMGSLSEVSIGQVKSPDVSSIACRAISLRRRVFHPTFGAPRRLRDQAVEDITLCGVWKLCGTVHHRGPDAGAVWVETAGGVALGQRRLAIIDLSPGGAQPMHSEDARWVITFNGEIYNPFAKPPAVLGRLKAVERILE